MSYVVRITLTCLAVICFTWLLTGAAACSNGVSLEERNDRIASSTVHTAAVGLGEVLKNISDESQRVDLIRRFIDPVRFFDDESGYFYVYYYNCMNLAHAIDKTLPGRDLTGYQDSKGMYVIQELSKKAKAGGGFITFYWPHPETKEEQRKSGYVEPIPGTDYFIGTGYYPNTK